MTEPSAIDLVERVETFREWADIIEAFPSNYGEVEGKITRKGAVILDTGAAKLREAADTITRLQAALDELVHELRYVESVYRQNCVAEREPSSLLEGVQKLLAKYEHVK